MKNKLPVEIENYELPYDEFSKYEEVPSRSYGYVSFIYLLSLIITVASVLAIVFLGGR